MEANRYVLISPCRNEAEFARLTLDSVLAQSIPPALWVIVDDGSTDETPEILAEYAAKHDLVRVVRREDRGERKVGPGVIDAYYAGLDTVDLDDYDFLCKLDLDLVMPPRYFEILMQRMADIPRLGTASGKAYYIDKKTEEFVSEKIGDEMSVGASKFYRLACYRDIGGFVREVMWDGIDCHMCRMNGWVALSWDEEDLRFTHLRPMGSSQVGIFTGRQRHGYGQWFMGTGLLYMTASAVFRMTRPPLIFGGLGMWWGFVKSMLVRNPRFESPGFRKFLRSYQRRCLLFGKRRATKRLHDRITAG